ncbi:MAG: phosphate--acyl-ACP acyltransferase, partial [Candidatus Omnitrophota bacterium]
MRIGIDAMGGDRAPECIVNGAVMAVNEFEYNLTLIGDESMIMEWLGSQDYPAEKIYIFNTTQTIEM